MNATQGIARGNGQVTTGLKLNQEHPQDTTNGAGGKALEMPANRPTIAEVIAAKKTKAAPAAHAEDTGKPGTTQAAVSLFKRVNLPTPCGVISIRDFVKQVQDGTHAAAVAKVRQEVARVQASDLTPEQRKQAVNKVKLDLLPAVSLSGCVTSGGRAKAFEEGRFTHSGYLQLDFDAKDMNGAIATATRDRTGADPHILTSALSPTGEGVKGIMRIPVCKTPGEHLAAFKAAEAYMLATYGLKIDPATKDPSRVCYVTHDPQATWNGSTVPLPVPEPQELPRQPAATSTAPRKGLILRETHSPREDWTLSDLEDMLRPIQRPGYDEWLRISSGAWQEFGEAATPILAARWPEEFPGEYAEKFSHRLTDVSFGTVVHYAKDNGWKPARRDWKQPERIEGGTGNATTSTDPPAADPGAKIDAEALRVRAYAMRFNPDETPPADETCMVIGDIPIGARGNLTVPQGKSKVGKSAVISAVLGAAHRGPYQAEGDTLCIEWKGEATGAIIHMDTEQSRADWHALVCRGITRSGMPEVSPRLVSLPLVMFSRSERLAILKQTLAYEREQQGAIDLVVIDGVADLCISPNDEAEALELVSQLHALAQEYDCPIFGVLHENPGSEIGKTRGHLGSELNRKAFANLRIDKDSETSVSTLYGTDMRKRDIPREQGFCFAWDTEAEMHTFQGRAGGLKAAQREAEATTKARAEWEPIFEVAAAQRENAAFPALTPKEAAEIERDLSGKDNLTKTDTMKKRMQKAETLGVLRKSGLLHWTIIPAGTAGKERENGNNSRP